MTSSRDLNYFFHANLPHQRSIPNKNVPIVRKIMKFTWRPLMCEACVCSCAEKALLSVPENKNIWLFCETERFNNLLNILRGLFFLFWVSARLPEVRSKSNMNTATLTALQYWCCLLPALQIQKNTSNGFLFDFQCNPLKQRENQGSGIWGLQRLFDFLSSWNSDSTCHLLFCRLLIVQKSLFFFSNHRSGLRC